MNTPIDWTAVSAIVTALMTVATFISVLLNFRQLNILKAQWEEEKRPKIYPRIIVYNQAYFLEFFNAGKSDATNVDITICPTFISNLPETGQRHMKHWNNSPFFVKSESSTYALIGWCEEIDRTWKDIDFNLDIHGTYNAGRYRLDFSEPIHNLLSSHSMVVRTPTEHALEELAKGLVRPHRSGGIASVQEQLEDISSALNNIADSMQNH